MSAVTCDPCGTTAPANLEHSHGLPRGWEPYRPADCAGTVWCGACVGALIDDVLAAMRDADAGGVLGARHATWQGR